MIRIAYVVPTIPTRPDLLARALASIEAQTWPVEYVAVAMDESRSGGSATRNMALKDALAHFGDDDLSNCWIGFLDDDDLLLPHHCEYLISNAIEADVGVAIGWYNVIGGTNPFPSSFRGRTYNPDDPHCTPITYVARVDYMAQMMEMIGGFVGDIDSIRTWHQDEQVLSCLVRLGGHISLPEVSWIWVHGPPGGNTSGDPRNVNWPT